MDNVWIQVMFNDQPMDNIVVASEDEARKIIEVVENSGFEEYNEDVKNDWLGMGFSNNPKVTAEIVETTEK